MVWRMIQISHGMVLFNHKGEEGCTKALEGLFHNPANPIFEMTTIEIYEQAKVTT